MSYKVFFVEDEIVTREGIRDNIDWKANGFEFCGEASDGEMALPLLQTTRPDVMITDIKMPFMDGLQLCKIVRERMPKLKIIILSGHDEFEYAQKAIELGVTEYLLKPVTVKDLQQALSKIAVQIEKDRKEQEVLNKLQAQVEENRATLRERLLSKLVVGAVSPTEAIEDGQLLGLDLIARYYLVVILKIELGDRSEQFDYDEYQQFQNRVSGLVENNPDVFLLKKDWEYLALIMKGNIPEYLEEERDRLLGLIEQNGKTTRYKINVGCGTVKNRIAELYQSFVEALVNIQKTTSENGSKVYEATDKAQLLKIDKFAIENYLRSGIKEKFDEFFDAYLQPLGGSTIKSSLIRNYIVVDIIVAVSKLVKEWDGDIEQIIPELNSIESILTKIETSENLKDQAFQMMVNAMAFRDGRTKTQHDKLIRQAKDHIKAHYMDANLSLNEVAALVNLSPSHFSVVFAQETEQTFKDYLTGVRIQKAKELLRTTSLKAADISYQVGYNDPHYFSSAFKKNTGFSPVEFRLQAKP
jgi:two-component system response regulator YesN